MPSKRVLFPGAIISLLIMLSSAPLSYLVGYLCWPFFDFVREKTGISLFFEGIVWQLAVIFLTIVLTAVSFLIWNFCKQHAETLKAYLWISVTLGSLAVVIDILLFGFFGLLNFIGFTDVSFHRVLPYGLDFLINLLLLGFLFLGHAIFVIFVTRYHWQLI
jgi:hypothetical protein